MELKPIDIEDGIQEYLNEQSINAGAVPLRGDYEEHLPYVLVQRVGGQINSVIDTHALSIDVYGATWSQAMSTAATVIKKLRGLQYQTIKGAYCYTVSPSNAYNNPDPKNKEAPRVTFSAQITTRGVE